MARAMESRFYARVTRYASAAFDRLRLARTLGTPIASDAAAAPRP
jgi:hypothetical protein